MKIYTALGDSITAGVGASSPTKAYPHVVAKLLCDRSYQMAVDTFAHSGWTSTDLWLALLDHDFLPIAKSTTTSIWIGGNNLIVAGLLSLRGTESQTVPKLLSRYESDLSSILKVIRRISRTSIVFCTQYNPFPNTPAAAQAINALNEITQQIAFRYRTRLAPIHKWFEGNQSALIAGYRTGHLEDAALGSFPVHPNDKGHQLIAHGMLPLITI